MTTFVRRINHAFYRCAVRNRNAVTAFAHHIANHFTRKPLTSPARLDADVLVDPDCKIRATWNIYVHRRDYRTGADRLLRSRTITCRPGRRRIARATRSIAVSLLVRAHGRLPRPIRRPAHRTVLNQVLLSRRARYRRHLCRRGSSVRRLSTACRVRCPGRGYLLHRLTWGRWLNQRRYRVTVLIGPYHLLRRSCSRRLLLGLCDRIVIGLVLRALAARKGKGKREGSHLNGPADGASGCCKHAYRPLSTGISGPGG